LYILYIQDILDVKLFYIEKIPSILYIFSMPTENPKILITLNADLLTRIDDFRFDNRIDSRSEAIRRLIEEGLKNSASAKLKKGK